MTQNRTQRIRSYKSGVGLMVYGIEQWNAPARDWYIVGDSSTNKAYIEDKIEQNNIRL